VLASYLESRRPGQYAFAVMPVEGPELRAALADPDAVFCLSLCGLDEIHMAEDLFSALGSLRHTGAPTAKIVVGGAFFNTVSPEDFVERFPAVSHVVQGDGEEVLLHILDGAPGEVILHGNSFPGAGAVPPLPRAALASRARHSTAAPALPLRLGQVSVLLSHRWPGARRGIDGRVLRLRIGVLPQARLAKVLHLRQLH
jgi:hypothetical protein